MVEETGHLEIGKERKLASLINHSWNLLKSLHFLPNDNSIYRHKYQLEEKKSDGKPSNDIIFILRDLLICLIVFHANFFGVKTFAIKRCKGRFRTLHTDTKIVVLVGLTELAKLILLGIPGLSYFEP